MQDINLYQLLTFYAKKWKWITAATLLGALVGLIYTNYLQTPLYKSDATLLVVSEDSQKTAQDSILINNYLELIKSRRVLEPVINRYHQTTSYDELVKMVTATSTKNTEVIKISIASKDPETSKKLVDGTIESFRDAIKDLYDGDNISTVDSASKEGKPYNVHQVMQLALTTVGGLMLSIIGLFFVYDLGVAKKTAPKVEKVKKQEKPADIPPVIEAAGPIQPQQKTNKKAVNKVVKLIIGDHNVVPAQPVKKKRSKQRRSKNKATKSN